MKRLSKEQIKTCIGILEKASGRVEQKKEKFICWAIAASEEGNQELGNYLALWIMSMIQKQAPYENSLENWAAKTRNAKNFHPVKSRLAMIDWMIAELRKELK